MDDSSTHTQHREIIPPAVQLDNQPQRYTSHHPHFNLSHSAAPIDSGPRRLEPASSVEGAHYLLPYLNLKEGDHPTRIRDPHSWLELSAENRFTQNEENFQSEQRWDQNKADLTFNYKRRAREAQKSKRRRNNNADDM